MWQILIVILGMILGLYLGKKAKDEIDNGKRYFLIAEKVLLLTLIAVILFFIKLNILVLIGLVTGLVICRFFKRIYFYFGVLIFSVINNKELFLSVISLIFLFSLIYNSLSKFRLRSFIIDIILFLIPFSLLAVESFINAEIGFLIGFSVGAVIEWALSSAW